MVSFVCSYIKDQSVQAWDYIYDSVSSAISELTEEQLMHITAIALLAIGFFAALILEEFTFAGLFLAVGAIETYVASSVFDYNGLLKKILSLEEECTDLKKEIKDKKELSGKLTTCTETIQQLQSQLGPLQERLSLFETAERNIREVVDMVVEERTRNAALLEQLKEAGMILNASTGKLEKLVGRLEGVADRLDPKGGVQVHVQA